MQEYISQKELKTIENLEFFARQVVEGFITGLHKSPYHGFSVEFAEHRLYNSGESTRHIDWKLFARTDKLFVKRFEEETNLRCQLVIDRSSSMHFPVQKKLTAQAPNKIGFSILAAAALMNLFKRQRDAVGLSVFSDKVQIHTRTRTSAAHHKRLLWELESLAEPFNEKIKESTNAVEALHEIADRIHQRSLVVLFSDLLGTQEHAEDLFSALQHLKYNKHEVIVFHVIDRARELNFDFDPRMHKFVDLETGEELKVNPVELQDEYVKQMSVFEQELKVRCGHYKIDFVPVDCTQGFEQVLLSYLLKRKKLY
ncbi:MAG: DUF58 domain-containing protein [Flavobacteriales bacterium]|nr:DUF58 domain-containing protein [Flavobacteriales bacterium]